MNSLVSIKPWTLEEIVDFFDAETRYLWNHKEDVNEGHQTPAGEEKKSAPVISVVEERGDAILDGVDEDPVEGLADGSAEGTQAVRPKFPAEDIR